MDDPSLDRISDESMIDNQNINEENNKKKFKFSFFLLYCIIIFIIFFLTTLEIFAAFYFTFCGIASLTINLFIYDWLSLFTKRSIFFFLSILSNFSDFGLFFILSIFIIFTIDVFFTLAKLILQFYINIIKDISDDDGNDDEKSSCFEYIELFFFCLLSLLLASGFFILFFFILYKWLFYFSAIYEIAILFNVLSHFYLFLKKYMRKNASSINEDTSNMESMSDLNIMMKTITIEKIIIMKIKSTMILFLVLASMPVRTMMIMMTTIMKIF